MVCPYAVKVPCERFHAFRIQAYVSRINPPIVQMPQPLCRVLTSSNILDVQLVFVIGNVAYGLSLIEYGTTSLLTIRIAACAGCTLTVVYFAMQPAVPWVAVGWNMVFCAILAVCISFMFLQSLARAELGVFAFKFLQSLAIAEHGACFPFFTRLAIC